MANCFNCGSQLTVEGACTRCDDPRAIHEAKTVVGPIPARPPREARRTSETEVPWALGAQPAPSNPNASPPERITTADLELLGIEAELAAAQVEYAEDADVVSLDEAPVPDPVPQPRKAPRPAPPGPALGGPERDEATRPLPRLSSPPRTATPAPEPKKGAVRDARLKPAPAPRGTLVASPGALWRRLLASVIDLTLLGGALALYLAIATAVADLQVPPSTGGLDEVISLLYAWRSVLGPGLVLGSLLALAGSVVFAVGWGGRSPGRYVAGLRLVDRSGLPPTPARAVARALLCVPSALLLFGGFWLALFDRQGQTLHDKLTSTFVVRPKPVRP